MYNNKELRSNRSAEMYRPGRQFSDRFFFSRVRTVAELPVRAHGCICQQVKSSFYPHLSSATTAPAHLRIKSTLSARGSRVCFGFTSIMPRQRLAVNS